MIHASALAPSLSGLLTQGETPFFASPMVAGPSMRATALSPLLRLPLLLGWRKARRSPPDEASAFALPAAGVAVLTDSRLMLFDGGRRGAALTPLLGDLVVAVDRKHVRSLAYDNSGLGWQTLTFHLDDSRTLGIAVPKMDVGEWLEQFPSADEVPPA